MTENRAITPCNEARQIMQKKEEKRPLKTGNRDHYSLHAE
jgi:hypothetical protein